METVTKKFDLHMHSNASDGTETPAKVIALSKENGLSLCALSDHDGVIGDAEAAAEANRLGIAFLPSIEMDNEFTGTLHILGLDIDPNNENLLKMLAVQRKRRNARNAAIVERLRGMGCDITPFLPENVITLTRAHIAQALAAGGFCSSAKEAFARYIGNGKPGYVPAVRFTPEEVITGIRGAGGIAVLAHPCLMSGTNIEKLIDRLTEAGLGGIEAYYSAASNGQTVSHRSFAEQRGLLVTAGSDFHGTTRPGADPGCAWQDVPCLNATYDHFMQRVNGREKPMEKLLRNLLEYEPKDGTEAADRAAILAALDAGEDLLTRENEARHLTASCWIVNRARTKVLMCYHNIYNSWSWTGGHADGEADLALVAMKEAREETGLKDLRLVSESPASVEILPVEPHVKRGRPVAAHRHLNLTFVIEADEEEPLTVKPDENSALRWFENGAVEAASSEAFMRPVYKKLIERTGKRA